MSSSFSKKEGAKIISLRKTALKRGERDWLRGVLEPLGLSRSAVFRVRAYVREAEGYGDLLPKVGAASENYRAADRAEKAKREKAKAARAAKREAKAEKVGAASE